MNKRFIAKTIGYAAATLPLWWAVFHITQDLVAIERRVNELYNQKCSGCGGINGHKPNCIIEDAARRLSENEAYWVTGPGAPPRENED